MQHLNTFMLIEIFDLSFKGSLDSTWSNGFDLFVTTGYWQPT